MYQVHLWPATIHWQILSHKDVSSTPLTCHNSLTNSYNIKMYQVHLWPATIHWQIISSNCIKYTSDLPQFTGKLYHIKMYQVHLWPATIYWQILSYQTVSSTPLTCHNSLTNTIISNCIKYTSDLPQFTDKYYHIKLYQVHLWPASIHWHTLRRVIIFQLYHNKIKLIQWNVNDDFHFCTKATCIIGFL
jgi:hypothetical protein